MNEKTNLTATDFVRPGNRRSFLRSAGVLALAAPAAMAGSSRARTGPSEWWHSRDALRLLAEGVLPNIEVTPAIPWVLPPMDVDPTTPGIQPPAIPPGFEVRLRVTYPVAETKNLLAVQIYVVPQGLPLPLPVAPEPESPGTITYLEMEVQDVQLGTSPIPGAPVSLPSLVLVGKATANPVPSPFGNLSGASCMVSASYQIMDPAASTATFVMLGTACAGNHVTLAPSAAGALVLKH